MSPVTGGGSSPLARWTEPLAATLLSGLLLALVCGPVALAGWQVDDDHEIIRNARSHLLQPQLGPPSPSLAALVEHTAANGRFFPLTSALRLWVSRVAGPEPIRLHLVMLFVGWLCLLALYGAGRNMGLGFAPALLWPVLTFLAPDAFSNWFRLGTGESWGSLFLAAALFAAMRRPLGSWRLDCAAVAAAFLSSLCKESFVAILPAFALVIVLVHRGALGLGSAGASPWSRGGLWPRAATWTLCIFTLLVAVLVAITWLAPSATEGRLALGALRARAPEMVSLTVLAIFIVGGTWLPLVVLWLSPPRPGVCLRRTARVLCLLAAVWVIPQEAIYVGRGGTLERFALPAAIGASLCVVLALEASWRHSGRRLRILLGTWLVLWLALALLHTVKAGSAVRADTLALNEMVANLAGSLPKHAVVVVATPPSRAEALLSVATLLANAGRGDLVFRYWRSEERPAEQNARHAWIEGAAPVLDQRAAAAFGRPSDQDLLRAAAVIYLGPIGPHGLGSSGSWALRQWCEPRITGDLLKGVLVAPGTTCYSAGLRRGRSYDGTAGSPGRTPYQYLDGERAEPLRRGAEIGSDPHRR
jgi:hypothetical protein